jgi:hypothetical protein
MRIVRVALVVPKLEGPPMLKPPRDAQEAFDRLAPDLEEIVDFINNCPLSTAERMQVAKMLGDCFHGLGVGCELAGIRVVGGAEAHPGDDGRAGTV